MEIVDITKNWRRPECRICDNEILNEKAVRYPLGYSDHARRWMWGYYHIECVKKVVNNAV